MSDADLTSADDLDRSLKTEYEPNPKQKGPASYELGWPRKELNMGKVAKARKNGQQPKPHNFDQAKLERKMQRIVLERLVK